MTTHARIPRLCSALAFAALLCAPLTQGSAQAVINKIGTRALTPMEISDLGLPGGTVKSAGLPTVGVGEPVYLEVQVETGTVVNSVVWSLTVVPGSSSATLDPSPLGLEIPIYNLGDREVAEAVSRKLLVPDTVGQYLVEATVNTDGDPLNLSLWVTAANYVGVGTINGASPSIPQCGVCHGDFAAENKVAGWEGTNHAEALIAKINNVGQPGDHFGEHCLSCHTLGYNEDVLADNGGFDDVAADLTWEFPTEAGTHWDDMPNALKQKSNIQCENCHGAGSEHIAQTDMNQISVSISAGDCAQCHDSPPYHTKVSEWNLSGHAVTTRYPTGSESRQSCVRCHSGVGFIDYTDGLDQSEFRFEYESIACQVCHDPHNGENHHQLRTTEDITLANGEVVTAGGAGKLCMNCHQSRYEANDTAENSSRIGPHHGPQGDMLAGTNAVEYGKQIASSGHLNAIENSCVTCHMQELPNGDPAQHLAGGHTFKIAWDNGTPEIEGDDVPLTAACANCHGDVPGFNFAQEDYDGDGIVEGVQDEVQDLLDILATALPPEGSTSVGSASSMKTLAQRRAYFNYLFVEEDRSLGVHNTSYAVGILKASIEDVMVDDADNDGLRDGFEIANFGSIAAQSADDDFDGDGLTNLEEQNQGTNPKSEDTDGDGFKDRDEILLGHDPTDSEDNPSILYGPIIRPAIEMLFFSETGKSYQVQTTTSLEGGVWEDVGDPVNGGDDLIQTFFSTFGQPKAFYRVKEL